MKCSGEDATPLETCGPPFVLSRTDSVPNVAEWCDGMNHRLHKLGGLEGEGLEMTYEQRT